MRLDQPSRSFLALFAVPYVLGAFLGTHTALLFGHRVATGGLESLHAQAHHLAPALVVLAALLAAMVSGVLAVRRQLACTRRLEARIHSLTVPPPPTVLESANAVGLEGRVDLVEHGAPFAFTYGARTPRVAVSTGLVEAASRAELEAVLQHERYHVANLDPLKIAVARAAPRALFGLPLLHDLQGRYVVGRELEADRQALRVCGPRPLAGALYKVVRGPAWPEMSAAAAIGGPELLALRVAQLETGQPPPAPGISVCTVLLSLPALLVVVAAVTLVVASVGGLGPVVRSSLQLPGPRSLGVLGVVTCASFWGSASWALYRLLMRRRS